MNENIILFAILRPPSNASYYCISGYEGGEERGGGVTNSLSVLSKAKV